MAAAAPIMKQVVCRPVARSGRAACRLPALPQLTRQLGRVTSAGAPQPSSRRPLVCANALSRESLRSPTYSKAISVIGSASLVAANLVTFIPGFKASLINLVIHTLGIGFLVQNMQVRLRFCVLVTSCPPGMLAWLQCGSKGHRACL